MMQDHLQNHSHFEHAIIDPEDNKKEEGYEIQQTSNPVCRVQQTRHLAVRVEFTSIDNYLLVQLRFARAPKESPCRWGRGADSHPTELKLMFDISGNTEPI